jgi:hypothetical protein
MAETISKPAVAGKRTYYLLNRVHDALSGTADELRVHFRLRVTKAEAMAAIIDVGLRHLDEVRQVLADGLDAGGVAPQDPRRPQEPPTPEPPAAG